MNKIINAVSGKKTYIVAVLTGVCAGLEAYGIHIPEYVYTGLAAAGLGVLRLAVAK